MKITVKKVIGLFVLLQLYQPFLNKDDKLDDSRDFATYYSVPPAIGNFLRTSCYDCHSNNTRYAWYDRIQPARILVEQHIKDGKKELNFNEWGSYSTRRQERLLSAIKKQVEAGEMPLCSYTIFHTDAKLLD